MAKKEQKKVVGVEYFDVKKYQCWMFPTIEAEERNKAANKQQAERRVETLKKQAVNS